MNAGVGNKMLRNANKEIGNDPNKLEDVEPAAYKALPSSYKNDHALTFHYDENGELCATHDLGGEFCWNGKKWSKKA